jgi:hypothetical protein
MPITKHDVPSSLEGSIYPIFWGVVQDLGHEVVGRLEPRDRKWIEQEPNTLKRLLTRTPKIREKSNGQEVGGGGHRSS